MNEETTAHLRMAFAGLAMQALIPADSPGHEHYAELASKAVKYADALIAALTAAP